MSEAPKARARELAGQAVVAVDCNGADLGPAEVASGAAIAAHAGARTLLFGPADDLTAAVQTAPPGMIEVVDAPVSIAKSADPARAARMSPDASIVMAARAVAGGRAQALVCAGGTGAALAAGTFNIKRARGIYRPALAIALPIPRHPVTLLDVGASSEARPEHLVQFAFMGAALAQTLLDLPCPRVGLLSNGEEAGRGSALVIEVHEQLARGARGAGDTFEFIGNVEGTDVVSGVADVIVTDGFTGNIALKLMEGVSAAMLRAIRDAAMSSTRAKLGGALLRGALRSFREEIDPESNGGAYLLGLRQLGVVPHGRFTRGGFAHAIARAERGARADIVGHTQLALERAGALRRTPVSAQDASLPQAQ
ncbi:MAG TPA: phosphate acyltransferase PlsX [Solirubrobacteraceae bacterium]|nr:phosphate acyltransferase PlsX [Solirubrobacteraceae bacterium]